MEEEINKEIENKPRFSYGTPFFNFDEIEYYHIDILESKAMEIWDKPNKSPIEQLKVDILIKEKPENLNNLTFIQSLNTIGFTKSLINPSQFKDINLIFSEKSGYESYVSGCIPVYRDILVFKKDNKIIGVSKICFDCHLFRIIGTSANTENFGQDGDFDKLLRILKS